MLPLMRALLICVIVSKTVWGLPGPQAPLDSLDSPRRLAQLNDLQVKLRQLSRFCQDYSPVEFRVALPYVSPKVKVMDGHVGLIKSEKIYWDVATAFAASDVKLGEGGFGIVKEVCFPNFMLDSARFGTDPGNPLADMVAIKRVTVESLRVEELELFYLLTENPDAPRFYGCMFDAEKQFAYILQTRLQTSLEKARKLFQASANKQARWFIIKNLVLQSAKISKLGYVHNDIKPDNVMLFEAGNKLAIIDYGLAQKAGERAMCGGTPFYMRWTKCEASRPVAAYSEDLYSVALTIASLESTVGESPMFITDPTTKKVTDTCERKHKNGNCRMQVYLGAMSILKKSYPELFKNRDEFKADTSTKEAKDMDLLDVIEAVLSRPQFDISADLVAEITERFYKQVIQTTYPDISAPFVIYEAPAVRASCSLVNLMFTLIQKTTEDALNLPDHIKKALVVNKWAALKAKKSILV